MIATVKPVVLGQKPSILISPLSSNGVSLPRSADSDLTSLSWLQKPGVLSSMCTALTGSPHKHSRVATRKKTASQVTASSSSKSLNKATETDRMVNVILNVRSRKFDYENEWNKPPLSFACLIFMALESTENKTMPVKEIYDYIEWKFPFYRTAPTGWKNSIRHNLSLNKCFRKLDRFSTRSKNALCKGGYWTVDPEYRRCLLEALERCPYHPYHNYTSPPGSPSSSGSFESLGPDERDAALTMCMISGLEGDLGLLSSVHHDHSYCKRPPKQATKKSRRKKKGLTLDEIAAAAEMILAQEESDCSSDELSESGDLGDSGYGGGESPIDTSLSMEELGADALLCLANNS